MENDDDADAAGLGEAADADAERWPRARVEEGEALSHEDALGEVRPPLCYYYYYYGTID